ncbi:ATP-binding protein [Actinoallomurus soli]|uniref:ATP-binding protein n=1 Tax=Actinoallomurus soli TaxID=2952535 RepID=UPI0027E27A6E|nr:ATP-binding protein [Actinoallomurus soli]
MFLPHAPSSVSEVRKRLCAELRASGVYEEIADDAAVIISELISNALRHARPLPSGDIRVSWTHEGELIQLAVSDGGSMTEPRRTRAALSSLGGRGLSIVEALSDKWGVSHEAETTTVWAKLRVDQQSSNGRAAALMMQPLHIAFDQSA